MRRPRIAPRESASASAGTGKTGFTNLGVSKTKVNVRMGVIAVMVGGTEQNIASAFREAEAERAILFLDEIDGLVKAEPAPSALR